MAAGWAGNWGAWARPLRMRDSTSRDAIKGKEPESCFKVVVAWEFPSFLRTLERSAVVGVDGRRGDIASRAKAE